MKSAMTFARARYLVVGIAAGLGCALWFSGIAPPIGLTAGSSWASTIIQAFAVMATVAVAMLATVISGLVASGWQADMQSQQAWAQLRLTPAEWSLPVDPRPARDIDPRYLVPADNEALRQVFRAHRCARPETVDQGIADVPVGIRATRAVAASNEAIPEQRTRDAAPTSVRDRENNTGELSKAGTSDRVLGKLVGTSIADVSKVARSHRAAKFRVKRAASRPRLVANSHDWSGRLARDARVPALTTADIIVLSGGRDDQTLPLPDAFVGPNGSESAAPPGCRGPPQVATRRSRIAATTSARRSVERAGVAPARDPIVRDDLGQQIPVCVAELDVIETYLGHMLQDLLASSTAKPDSKKT